jgi:hypothetical protein
MEVQVKPTDERLPELAIGVMALALTAAMVLFVVSLWGMMP